VAPSPASCAAGERSPLFKNLGIRSVSLRRRRPARYARGPSRIRRW
jgi:hypothetical protein